MNVGIFLPNWIGDVAMATPSLRALRQTLGRRGRLVGIMRPYVSEVLSGTRWLDREIYFDPRSTNPELTSAALTRQLRKEQLDSVLLLTNSLRSAWIAWRSRIPQRIGYARYGRSLLLTERLHAPRDGWNWKPVSAVDYYCRLVETLGISITSRELELATTSEKEREVDQIWKDLDLAPDATVVALNSGGAYGAAKDWPTDHFVQLARLLANHTDGAVLVICGPAEQEKANRIARLAEHPRVFSLARFQPHIRLSIGLSKAVIRRCQLLVSTDSGPRHFGAAFDVPTVSLFGPTDPRWSSNYHRRQTELQRALPCGPCAARQCPLHHHRCMQELSVSQVFQAAQSLLSREPTQRAA